MLSAVPVHVWLTTNAWKWPAAALRRCPTTIRNSYGGLGGETRFRNGLAIGNCGHRLAIAHELGWDKMPVTPGTSIGPGVEFALGLLLAAAPGAFGGGARSRAAVA